MGRNDGGRIYRDIEKLVRAGFDGSIVVD